jgi:predicted alpha/beta-hydrolase family hydrolase
MTGRRDLEWAPGRQVPLITVGSGPIAVLLAHGAGAGQGHPFMAAMRARLAEAYSVTTFDYPYVAEGRRAPDRMATLVECHRVVAESVAAAADRLVLGGKSMGGRMASHLADPDAAPRFFLGYPLVPIGKSEPRDTSHLDGIDAPLLFVQGERDRLGPPEMIAPIVDRLARAWLVVVPDADHSFKVPKRTGIDEEEVLDRLATIVKEWLAAIGMAPG